MENGSTFPYCRRTIKTDGVTQKGKPASYRMEVQGCRKVPQENPRGRVSETRIRELRLTKWPTPRCQEKPLRSLAVTVPQTDTGG